MGIIRDLFGSGTWGVAGNLVASVILGALTVSAAWIGRHKLGHHLAAWLDKHLGPHLEKRHLNALRARDVERRETRLRQMAALRERHEEERGSP